MKQNIKLIRSTYEKMKSITILTFIGWHASDVGRVTKNIKSTK
jgi:hypothetical protein